MIDRVEFETNPIEAGQSRSLTAWSKLPLFVEVKCFTNQPPPPGYRACAACGTINVTSGQTIQVKADAGAFRDGGNLVVVVKDSSGDTRKFELFVTDTATGSSSAIAAA